MPITTKTLHGNEPPVNLIARIEDLEAKVNELTHRLNNGDAAEAQRFHDLEQQVQDLADALRKLK